ncbi:ABC transporter ATP-binding protein [Sinorhizobium meliloti]|nr:ABC transporter ATP-binding protein [Sinorhizobium meliloti]RVL59820.1 ABC transporter ATP-binding protein [Sinorhizobium meliloti]RVQ71504.1 ABC transporter ATP-binding protein [Sinorhizobium meliloti]
MAIDANEVHTELVLPPHEVSAGARASQRQISNDLLKFTFLRSRGASRNRPELRESTARRRSEELVVENEVSAIALEARELTKIYRMGAVEVHALRGVEVDFREGELIVLLGPSGSGKSTLLNILGGLDTPTSGTVMFRGQPLTMDSERALNLYRRNHVGFVFQFYNLIPSLTARENVSLVTEIARNPMSPVEALSIVGLGDRLDHFPAQLSGGEQQRVAIARAIAKRPDLLLCDEPTGALDSKTGILVLEAILKINRELGTTTALITHNAVIAEIANRVLYFADGRIVETRQNGVQRAPGELAW